ncbi:MAG: hypothetical protein R3E68_19840 [Burkholderiaceae bacterium]
MKIETGGLGDPRVIALLDQHLRSMREISPPESVHGLSATRKIPTASS